MATTVGVLPQETLCPLTGRGDDNDLVPEGTETSTAGPARISSTNNELEGIITVAGPISLGHNDKYISYASAMQRSSIMFLDWFNYKRKGILINGTRYGARIHWVSDASDRDQAKGAMVSALRRSNATFATGPYSSTLTKTASLGALEEGRILMAAAATHTDIYRNNPLIFGTLPHQERGKSDFSVVASQAILEAAGEIDAGTRHYVPDGRCAPPHCRNSLLAGFVRSYRGSPGYCPDSETLWVSGNFPVASNGDGSWASQVLVAQATMREARAALENLKALGVNVLVLCGHYEHAKLLIASMEELDYSPYAFLATTAVNSEYEAKIDNGWWQGFYTMAQTTWNFNETIRGEFSGMTSLEFYNAYNNRFGLHVDYRGASQFAAHCALFSAIERAQSLDTDAVASELRRLKLREFFGTINFNSNGQNDMQSLISQVQPPTKDFEKSRNAMVAPADRQTALLMFPTPTWALRRCQRFQPECSGHGHCSYQGTCVCEPGWGDLQCLVKLQNEGKGSIHLAIIVLAIIGCVLILLILIYAMVQLVRSYLDGLRAQKHENLEHLRRVTAAIDSITKLKFYMCLCSYKTMEGHGRLVSHEEACEAGDLIVLHTYPEADEFSCKHATLFVSHQWLGFSEPDPHGQHYKAICQAGARICRDLNVLPENLFLWVDYFSIPQQNTTLKELSIGSLAVYASVARYFVIICPNCLHVDADLVCNAETYHRRGWCRLEQWARMAVDGPRSMYMFGGNGKLRKLEDDQDWYHDSIHVFNGDFTVESDKAALVDTVISLWALCTARKEKNEKIYNLITENKASVFPRRFFGPLIEILEENFDGMMQPGTVKTNLRASVTGRIVHAAARDARFESISTAPRDSGEVSLEQSIDDEDTDEDSVFPTIISRDSTDLEAPEAVAPNARFLPPPPISHDGRLSLACI